MRLENALSSPKPFYLLYTFDNKFGHVILAVEEVTTDNTNPIAVNL